MSTVLLVDDEEGYRTYVRRGLERQGVKVELAATADEAWTTLRDTPIDLMIVDVRLADGANGLDLAEQVKSQNSSVALVVITGHSSPEYERRSHSLGAIDYLEKPFDLHTLELCVGRFLDRHELLREMHRLEQELASAYDAAPLARVVSGWPIACVAETGEILYATPAALAALQAVADPSLERPLQRVDQSICDQLRCAPSAEEGMEQITLFRRDGVISHFTVFLQHVDWRSQPAALVFLHDARDDTPRLADDLWLDLLMKASSQERVLRT